MCKLQRCFWIGCGLVLALGSVSLGTEIVVENFESLASAPVWQAPDNGWEFLTSSGGTGTVGALTGTVELGTGPTAPGLKYGSFAGTGNDNSAVTRANLDSPLAGTLSFDAIFKDDAQVGAVGQDRFWLGPNRGSSPSDARPQFYINKSSTAGKGRVQLNRGGGAGYADVNEAFDLDTWNTYLVTYDFDAKTWDLEIKDALGVTVFNEDGNYTIDAGNTSGAYATWEVRYGVNGTGQSFAWNVDNINLAFTPPDLSIPGTWAFNRSGDWNVAANWDPTVIPNANVASVFFHNAITSPATVFTNSAVIAKQITFDNANSYAIAGTGSVNLQADTGNASINVVQGTHQFQANVNLLSNTDSNIAAGATLEFNNRLSLGGNTLTKTGDGALKINNDLNTGGGSILVAGGSVGGGGSIGGDLANTGGTVAPGNSPGTLSVLGSYTQSAGGTLAIEIAGLAAGTQYDQLVVTGNATLNGTLAVTLLNSFAPSLGDSFNVLTYGSHSGTFSSTTGTTLGGFLALKPTYGSTELLLKARPAQDGDINLDGVVNIFDINAVSSHWSETGPQGDANGDGTVNIFDINLISSNWGATGGATAVPEPSSWILLALGGVLGVWRLQRRGRISPQT